MRIAKYLADADPEEFSKCVRLLLAWRPQVWDMVAAKLSHEQRTRFRRARHAVEDNAAAAAAAGAPEP